VSPERDGELTRARILAHIEGDPGVHKSALCRELGLGWGTVCYHVRVLGESGHINAFTHGREVFLFPGRVAEQQMRWIAALREDVGKHILDELGQQPGSRLKDLSESLGRSRKVIRRHLTLLDEAGLVDRRGQHQARYSLPDPGDELPGWDGDALGASEHKG
jgi:predicted transcriptional regulator